MNCPICFKEIVFRCKEDHPAAETVDVEFKDLYWYVSIRIIIKGERFLDINYEYFIRTNSRNIRIVLGERENYKEYFLSNSDDDLLNSILSCSTYESILKKTEYFGYLS